MTGELVAAARARIDRIKAHVGAAREELIEAWRQRDWITLGYQSWDAMCEAEFAGVRIALSIEDRRDLVGEYHDEGMSTRAIASAIGVSQATVMSDLQSTEQNRSVDEVTSLDGRKRPATQPPRVEDSAPRPSRTLDDILANDADVIAANRRARLAHYLTGVHRPMDDAAEMARVAPDMADAIETALTAFQRWVSDYRAALPSRLQIVKGQ